MVYDEYIHASVHDGLRMSRLSEDARIHFAHNSVPALHRVLKDLLASRESVRTGEASVFVAVESLYSMEGTLAPLLQIVEAIEELRPHGNGYLFVDEAHATGIYGPRGEGLVSEYGLEGRVFARMHTFGKAIAGTGGEFSIFCSLVITYLRS